MLKEAEVAKWSKVSCAVGLRDAARYKKELEQRVEQLQKNMEAELYVARTGSSDMSAWKIECCLLSRGRVNLWVRGRPFRDQLFAICCTLQWEVPVSPGGAGKAQTRS